MSFLLAIVLIAGSDAGSVPYGASEECLSYVPKSLTTRPHPSVSGAWQIVSSGGVLQSVFGEPQAKAVVNLASQHTKRCRIGKTGGGRFIEYWEGRTTKAVLKIDTESCIAYSRQRIRIEYVSGATGGWHLLDGRSVLMVFDDKPDATAALALAQKHDEYCIIGRGAPVPTNEKINYVAQFWR
jgi:hypothetical protein